MASTAFPHSRATGSWMREGTGMLRIYLDALDEPFLLCRLTSVILSVWRTVVHGRASLHQLDAASRATMYSPGSFVRAHKAARDR